MKTFKSFKAPASIGAALSLALGIFILPGTAWSGLREDMHDFHSFLRERPRVAADLRANPHLVNSRSYLDRHDQLARFLWRRPALRAELRHNPGRVMRYSGYPRYDRYDRYDRYGWWR